MSEHIKHKFPSRNLTNVSFRSSSSVKEEEAACRSFFISIIKFLKDFSPMPLSLVPGNWRVKSPIELGPFLSSEHIVLVDLPEGGRKTVQLITWSPPTNMSFSKPKAHQLTSLIHNGREHVPLFRWLWQIRCSSKHGTRTTTQTVQTPKLCTSSPGLGMSA